MEGLEEQRSREAELLELVSAVPGQPSELANRLQKLREATFSAAGKRERLPHPLFWSLFHGEVSELRKKKDKIRELRKLLYSAAA